MSTVIYSLDAVAGFVNVMQPTWSCGSLAPRPQGSGDTYKLLAVMDATEEFIGHQSDSSTPLTSDIPILSCNY